MGISLPTTSCSAFTSSRFQLVHFSCAMLSLPLAHLDAQLALVQLGLQPWVVLDMVLPLCCTCLACIAELVVLHTLRRLRPKGKEVKKRFQRQQSLYSHEWTFEL